MNLICRLFGHRWMPFGAEFCGLKFERICRRCLCVEHMHFDVAALGLFRPGLGESIEYEWREGFMPYKMRVDIRKHDMNREYVMNNIPMTRLFATNASDMKAALHLLKETDK